MFVKIGDVQFANSDLAQYTITKYGGGSIGIRARVQSGEGLKKNEELLYHLREGRTYDVDILEDDGTSTKGSYKINELNWKKQKKSEGEDYELLFNLGLQKG